MMYLIFETSFSDPGNLFAIDTTSGEIRAFTNIAPENQYFAGGSITLTAYVSTLYVITS